MDSTREVRETQKSLRIATGLIKVRGGEIYVQIDDERIIPVLSGGMVEAALNELGGQLVEIEPGVPFGLN